MVMFLQIAVSVIFFTNKVLVLADKKVAWLTGAIAAAIALFYFYLIELYVYTVLEIGLITLMGYAFFKKERANPAVEMWIRVVTIVVMCALAIFAFSGLMTVVELVSSAGLLMGTYMLTHGKKMTGWILYIVGHSCAAYLGYHKGQQFFADLQVASVIVSMVGVWKSHRPTS